MLFNKSLVKEKVTLVPLIILDASWQKSNRRKSEVTLVLLLTLEAI